MPYNEFQENDIFRNVLETHPKIEFFIHDRKIYYNGEHYEQSTFSENETIKHVPSGHIELYEININRREEDLIYPFIVKSGTSLSFRTISLQEYQSFSYGDEIRGKYPQASTISIDRYLSPEDEFYDVCGKDRRRLVALKNTLNYYKLLSPHYAFESDYHNLMTDRLSLISVPSIFFGSYIEKGSVKLEYRIHGEVIATLEDVNKNGELIQTYGKLQGNTGKVAGIVLYNEGFIILTGQWELSTDFKERYKFCPYPINIVEGEDIQLDYPRWIHWGTQGYIDENGLPNDPETIEDTPTSVINSSFYLKMNGTTNISTLTMLAHAKKGELNHSNNPTYLKNDQESTIFWSGSSGYHENSNLQIKNTVYSPYNDPAPEFAKQTWISKIGIYDENRNLIAIAKLAKPILKKEDREFTFKLKLDF